MTQHQDSQHHKMLLHLRLQSDQKGDQKHLFFHIDLPLPCTLLEASTNILAYSSIRRQPTCSLYKYNLSILSGRSPLRSSNSRTRIRFA